MIQSIETNPELLAQKKVAASSQAESPLVSTYGKRRQALCMTDRQSALELQVGLGTFIPLWEKGMTLKWRFNQNSFAVFQEGAALMASIRSLMKAGMDEWGDSAPIEYEEAAEGSTADFDVIMQPTADCNAAGACVLASAFFPDSGKHKMLFYPTMFQQSADEQVATLAHEIGHTFGLRHYFAQDEGIKAVLFGSDSPLSIMNYDSQSVMTDTDRNDLKALYKAVWDGSLTKIRDLPIRLFKPFNAV